MPLGNEILIALVPMVASPLVAFLCGYYRLRANRPMQSRFRKASGIAVIAFYGALIVTYGAVFAMYYGYGKEQSGLQSVGCFLFLAGPILAITLVVIAESMRTTQIAHRCRGCGYDLRATPAGRCPECGSET